MWSKDDPTNDQGQEAGHERGDDGLQNLVR